MFEPLQAGLTRGGKEEEEEKMNMTWC